MTETLVSYNDGETETTFIASYIPAKRWNGAAMPYFTFAEASRIAEDCAIQPWSQTLYRWNNGTFEEDLNTDDVFDVHNWAPVKTTTDRETGATLYEMGSGWTWFEISDHDVDNDCNDYAELRAAVTALSTDHAFKAIAGDVSYEH